MNDTNKNIDLSIIPDQEINTKEIFGIECPFKVCGFKAKNDHVPLVVDDTSWGHRGRAFANGYIQATIEAVKRNAR